MRKRFQFSLHLLLEDILRNPAGNEGVIDQLKEHAILKKRIIVSVTNDLTSDKRVDRVCLTLVKMGFDVLLIGRQRQQSIPLKPRLYKTKRMHLLFSKGPLFYAEFNVRLFLFLLFNKMEILLSNDLDTLPANYMVSKIKRKPLIHDCHEYFRGVPELNGRPFPAKAWKWIEDKIFPKLPAVYAVNESIAEVYRREYGNPVAVVRNVPLRIPEIFKKNGPLVDIPVNTKVILYQGSLNVDRGLEEAIRAMRFLTTKACLLIIGTGDVHQQLIALARSEGVADKVIFTGEIPFQDLPGYTSMANVGLSIEKDVSLNYHYCLPNKFLDYIQSRIPVLVSPLPEMSAIVQKYRIGEFLESHDPRQLASQLDRMLGDELRLDQYRKTLEAAAADLCWENEESILMNIFTSYV
jgi:glycosyltransferase involved in cell wall biosynthesis